MKGSKANLVSTIFARTSQRPSPDQGFQTPYVLKQQSEILIPHISKVTRHRFLSILGVVWKTVSLTTELRKSKPGCLVV
jgi:hypothetical protein